MKSLKCNLIIELFPPNIEEERIRKLRKLNKKKVRSDSKRFTDRAGLNLFINNVSLKKIAAKNGQIESLNNTLETTRDELKTANQGKEQFNVPGVKNG